MTKEHYVDARTSVNLKMIKQLQTKLSQVLLPVKFINAWEAQNLRRAVLGHFFLLIKDLMTESACENYIDLLHECGRDAVTNQSIKARTLEKAWQQLGGGKLTAKARTSLNDLCDWVNEDQQTDPVVMAGVAGKMVREEQIFGDLDELLARLLETQILSRAGFRVNAQFVTADWDLLSTSRYRGRVERPSQGDYVPWIDYYVKGVRYSLQASLDQVEQISTALYESAGLTTREKSVWEKILLLPGSQNLASLTKALGVSKQRAHVILESLASKGMIAKKGSGKKLWYTPVWRAWG